jgi:hypothetical protein
VRGQIAAQAFPRTTREAVQASRAELDVAARLARGRPTTEQAQPTIRQHDDAASRAARAWQQQQQDQDRGLGR